MRRPDRSVMAEEHVELLRVAAKPRDLFSDVAAIGENGDLLLEARAIERAFGGRREARDTLAQPCVRSLERVRRVRLDVVHERLDALEVCAHVTFERGTFARAHRVEIARGGIECPLQRVAQALG